MHAKEQPPGGHDDPGHTELWQGLGEGLPEGQDVGHPSGGTVVSALLSLCSPLAPTHLLATVLTESSFSPFVLPIL